MGVELTSGGDAAPDEKELEDRFRQEGMSPRSWASPPGEQFSWHAHDYHKVLYCLSGSIVFTTEEHGDLELHPGDRLDVEAGTRHAAVAGSDGVRCMEAARSD